MDGNDKFQTLELYAIGSRVRCVDKSKFFHNELATIIDRDGMGSYTLDFDRSLLNGLKLETRPYWELEVIP